MSDYLERELTRQLAPVPAPENLWDKCAEAGCRSPRRSIRRTMTWNPGSKMIFAPARVVVLVTVAAGAAWRSGQRMNPPVPAKLSAGRASLRTVTAGQLDDACMTCHTSAAL